MLFQELGKVLVVIASLALLAGIFSITTDYEPRIPPGIEVIETEVPFIINDIAKPVVNDPAPLALEPDPVFEEKIVEPLAPEPTIPTVEETIEEITPEIPAPISFGTVNAVTREALVNIHCTTRDEGVITAISGSGITIDEQGIILTNAHIAQHFLLIDYPTVGATDCAIRIGSPATRRYTAEILYIPTHWVQDNADNLTIENPTGSGQGDYALLRITGTTDPNAQLPASFPAIGVTVDADDVVTNVPVLLAAYPAGFLGGSTIQKNLYSSSAISVIGDVFTFGSNTIDIFSVGGSVVAQKGSSGGAVVNGSNDLVGLIVTSTDGESTGERDLRALALPYINRDLVQTTGFALPVFLDLDLAFQADQFNQNVAPSLTQLLLDELQN